MSIKLGHNHTCSTEVRSLARAFTLPPAACPAARTSAAVRTCRGPAVSAATAGLGAIAATAARPPALLPAPVAPIVGATLANCRARFWRPSRTPPGSCCIAAAGTGVGVSPSLLGPCPSNEAWSADVSARRFVVTLRNCSGDSSPLSFYNNSMELMHIVRCLSLPPNMPIVPSRKLNTFQPYFSHLFFTMYYAQRQPI